MDAIEDSSYVKNMEQEIQNKEELIEQANQLMMECNDDKHNIKARFKHLMQVLENPGIMPDEESSYKEDDNINISLFFDRFEQEALARKERDDIKFEDLKVKS